MADGLRVQGPVDIQNDSKERVAYDMAVRIAINEKTDSTRQYFLTLYRQCYKATHGYSLPDILKEEK